jgi:hypothetical protein
MQSPDDTWVDLATTAVVTSELLELYKLPGASERTDRNVRNRLFRAVSAIHRGRDSDFDFYPWSENPVTTLRCLRAWMLFDALLQSPVDEAVELAALRHSAVETERSQSSALDVLDAFREHSHAVTATNARLEAESTAAREQLTISEQRSRALAARVASSRRITLSLVVVLLYLLAFLVVGAAAAEQAGAGEMLQQAFVERWKVHGAVLGFTLAALAVPWQDILRRNSTQP